MGGGDGADRLAGGPRRDRMDGGFGNDAIIGGPGLDAVLYWFRTRGVLVVLGGTSGNREPGESDAIAADIERVEGGWGDDDLVGSDGPDRLDGGERGRPARWAWRRRRAPCRPRLGRLDDRGSRERPSAPGVDGRVYARDGAADRVACRFLRRIPTTDPVERSVLWDALPQGSRSWLRHPVERTADGALRVRASGRRGRPALPRIAGHPGVRQAASPRSHPGGRTAGAERGSYQDHRPRPRSRPSNWRSRMVRQRPAPSSAFCLPDLPHAVPDPGEPLRCCALSCCSSAVVRAPGAAVAADVEFRAFRLPRGSRPRRVNRTRRRSPSFPRATTRRSSSPTSCRSSRAGLRRARRDASARVHGVLRTPRRRQRARATRLGDGDDGSWCPRTDSNLRVARRPRKRSGASVRGRTCWTAGRRPGRRLRRVAIATG